MGKGIVDRLKEEFDISEEWVNFELHPETPSSGLLLSEKFPGYNLSNMYEGLRRMGKPYGIEFGDLNLLSNSRYALEAGEFAKEKGKFHEFHEKLFHACFTETKNIGDIDVLIDIAESIGLDGDKLLEALESRVYSQKIDDNHREASSYGVDGTPTFIINNKYKIVGAQPLQSFRTALLNIEKNEAE